jgi:4-hydroxy-tetrahydrodipicolinate reductase
MISGVGTVVGAIAGSVAEALKTPADVLVDYTKADAVKANVMAAIEKGVHVVIGSSGLTDADFEEIDRAAREKGVGVIAAGNFAITAVLLQRFACEAAKYLSQWEVIDYASDKKPDAPSGTVRELAYRLSEVRKPGPTIPVEDTLGEPATRGATINGIQVHSIRLPGYVIGVEAIFGRSDERLTLRHDAGAGAEPYIAGTMLAIRKVSEYTGLVRGLDGVME